MSKYKCEICGKTFERCVSEEEAKKECIEEFGPVLATMDQMVEVCDTCYKKIAPHLHPELLEKAKEEMLKQKKN